MGAPWLVETWTYDRCYLALYDDGVVVMCNRFAIDDRSAVVVSCELGETCPIFRTPHPLLKKPIRPLKR